MRHIMRLNKPNEIALIESKDHVTSHEIMNEYLSLNEIYDEKIKHVFNRFFALLHPFETIKTKVLSDYTPTKELIRITNAFMKIYEIAILIRRFLLKGTKIRMFDIASAPGMFILALEHFCNYYNLQLDWHACSYMDGATTLKDTYKIYENNPDRFTPCDVTKEEDMLRCMEKGKFDLVTGDIGIEHESDYSTLQEFNQLDLQWGQAILGLKLTEQDGCMILKMYTLLSEETHYLLDILCQYFEQVNLVKPFTSRVFNDECYIVCLKRNNVVCDSIPNMRPKISGYSSPNKELILEFEHNRASDKNKYSNMMIEILTQNPNSTFKDAMKNNKYKKYYDETKKINQLFYRMKSH